MISFRPGVEASQQVLERIGAIRTRTSKSATIVQTVKEAYPNSITTKEIAQKTGLDSIYISRGAFQIIQSHPNMTRVGRSTFVWDPSVIKTGKRHTSIPRIDSRSKDQNLIESVLYNNGNSLLPIDIARRTGLTASCVVGNLNWIMRQTLQTVERTSYGAYHLTPLGREKMQVESVSEPVTMTPITESTAPSTVNLFETVQTLADGWILIQDTQGIYYRAQEVKMVLVNKDNEVINLEKSIL